MRVILDVTFRRPRENNGPAMKQGNIWLLAACLAVLAAGYAVVLAGEEQGMKRYAIITERRPFGAEALPVADLPPVVPPEKSMMNQFRLSAVVRDDAGRIKVGLVELKSNRNFVLDIGESVDGVDVISADYASERARLRRGPEEYWVSMQGGSNRFERVIPGQPDVPDATVEPMSASPRARLISDGVDQRRSYALRRQQREEARLRKELERMRTHEAERSKEPEGGEGATVLRAGRPARGDSGAAGRAMVDTLAQSENIELTPEEIGNLLQEYQKELIRKGMKPLPIPLSPETDKELVEEGLLPPLE